MPKKIIYLIRHGESQSQSQESQDHVNPDLSARGIKQAKRLFPLLQGCHPQLILLSPLQRAWKTFQHAQITAPQIRFESRLIESYPPDFYAAHIPFATPAFAHAESESYYHMDGIERTDSLWQDIIDAPYQSIMLFCHWCVCANMLRSALGLPKSSQMTHPLTDNAALSIIEITEQNQSRLRIWNHTEHLHGLLPHDPTLGFLHR